MVEFHDRRNRDVSDFSIEPPMRPGVQPRTDLNVRGRPFHMAIHRAGAHYGPDSDMLEKQNVSYHGWMIPFEHGWELHLSGRFNQHGEPIEPLRGYAHHEPTRLNPNRKTQVPKYDADSINNFDELHEHIRKIANLPGGSET